MPRATILKTQVGQFYATRVGQFYATISMRDFPLVESDLWRWDYRHQVVAVKQLTPAQLLLGVKLVELIYHLHPRRLWQILAATDHRMRRQLRHCTGHVAAVYCYEIYEAVSRCLLTAVRRRGTPAISRPESDSSYRRHGSDSSWASRRLSQTPTVTNGAGGNGVGVKAMAHLNYS